MFGGREEEAMKILSKAIPLVQKIKAMNVPKETLELAIATMLAMAEAGLDVAKDVAEGKFSLEDLLDAAHPNPSANVQSKKTGNDDGGFNIHRLG